MRCTASAGRSRSPMSASRIRCARRSSKPRSRRAFRATTISTGRRRRAPAISSSRRGTAGAGRPRSAICGEARRRPNLAVVTNALASRILFEGRRAVGVEYRQGGTTRIAHASGEVILAGGAFNSPQLMQLSGLGPAELLRSHGIEVIADMPGVGADLQDHLQVRMQYRCTEPITMNDVVNSWRQRDRRRIALRLVRERACSRSAPAMPAASSAPARTWRRPTCRCTSSSSAARRRARRCIRSRASSHRSASCGRRAAASCASSRPIRPRRRRSSRAICQTRSTATRWWPA